MAAGLVAGSLWAMERQPAAAPKQEPQHPARRFALGWRLLAHETVDAADAYAAAGLLNQATLTAA
jgi:hypothetical protein